VRIVAIGLGIALIGASWGSEEVGYVAFGRSSLILGSMDKRTVFGVGVQSMRPERALRIRGNQAKLVRELYAYRSESNWFWAPPGHAYHVGALVSGRYEFGQGATRFFAEGGWGLQYSNRGSHDIESRWNSTPTVGIGAIFDSNLYLTLRLMHVSNGGLSNGRNKGQNWLMFMVGKRF